MLKIGITAGFIYPDPNRSFFSKKSLSFLENDTAALIARNGFLPILIPDVPHEMLHDYLKNIDGLVLQGGADMSPLSYKGDFLDKEKWPGDKYRDDFEYKLLTYAVMLKIPILGICRGIQVINAYFGGTLYQDIPTETRTSVVHANRPIYDENHHDIEIVGEGYLKRFYQGKHKIVSIHHQAIKDVAPGFDVEAVSSEDGIVEAISWNNMNEQYILGVQWHPEFAHHFEGHVMDPNPMIQDFFARCHTYSQTLSSVPEITGTTEEVIEEELGVEDTEFPEA
jgi:putative glutamine amidotransferase